jgi:uncharacterized protein (TIGR04255 family)
MDPRRHYLKSPIVEALLDIRVELPPDVKFDDLQRIYDRVSDLYPNKEEQLLFQAQITGGASVSATANQSPVGYFYSSENRKKVLQTKIDGLTYSHLAPYDSWENFRDEAKYLWGIYQEIANPKTIITQSIRYVNRFDIPLPIRDFKDYFLTFPEVSPNLPFQGLSGCFMQLQIPQEDISAMLLLSQAIIPPHAENVVSVLLDINIHPLGIIDDDMWNLFEQMHSRVDSVFEGCITNKTRALIK